MAKDQSCERLHRQGVSMTGLARGPGAPILRGHPQNFVFMITLLLLLLSPLSARRLINTVSYHARHSISDEQIPQEHSNQPIKQTNKQKNKDLNKQKITNERTNEGRNEGTKERTNERKNAREKMSTQTSNKRKNERTNRLTSKQTTKQTNQYQTRQHQANKLTN